MPPQQYDTINNNPIIKSKLTRLKRNKIFYVERLDGTHINLYGIKFDIHNQLIFLHNGQYKTVRSLIMEVNHLQSARWLNHVYFKNRDGRHKRFYKDYLKDTHNLNIS